MSDSVDNRVLAALRCVDRATGYILTRSLEVSSNNAKFIRNRSNLYVIQSTTNLEHHIDKFSEAPDIPEVESIEVKVNIADPLNKYLPRSFKIKLPRDSDIKKSTDDSSIYSPVNVKLYSAPNQDLMTNWSTVRVSVTRTLNDGKIQPVLGALVRIIRVSDEVTLSSGISDERGESLIIISGVPITQFSDEESDERGLGNRRERDLTVVVSELQTRLEVSYVSDQNWPVDPDFLESKHNDNTVKTVDLKLRTGRMEKMNIELND